MMKESPNYAELLQMYEIQSYRFKKMIKISDQQSKNIFDLTQKFEK